jgi:hypothetical protein
MRTSADFAIVGSEASLSLFVEMADENSLRDCSPSGQFPAYPRCQLPSSRHRKSGVCRLLVCLADRDAALIS